MEALLEGWPHQLLIVAEVALAMLLGGFIGLERELASKAAGFRTHMLVSGAAAMLVGMGDILVAGIAEETGDSLIRADPFRIMGAVVSGICFLGAGAIFRSQGNQVEGVTTAASLLVCASVGLAVGTRQWVLALGVTALTLAVLRALLTVERRLARRTKRD